MAAIETKITLSGLSELDEALRQLPEEVDQRIMEISLKEAGAVILAGARRNIKSRTGRTAADIRMEVQTPAKSQGVAAVGARAPRRGDRSRRGHVLRFLELGTKPHVEPKPRKKLRRFERQLGRTLKKINSAKRVAFGGKVFSRVKHPGIRNQSPLTRALAENGDQALRTLRTALWREIKKWTRGIDKGAA